VLGSGGHYPCECLVTRQGDPTYEVTDRTEVREQAAASR
jgi:hypothetical protein